MKTNKITATLFLFVLFIISINAQVKNTIFKKGDAFNTYNNLYVNFESIPKINLYPEVNFDSLIQEDLELDEQGVGRPFRFGYSMESNISMEQGIWTTIEQSNINVWSICISSEGAYSLNFLLSNVKLSPNTELYFFNPLYDFENIWKDPDYTDDYVTVKAVIPPDKEYVFEFRVSNNNYINSQITSYWDVRALSMS